MNTMFMPEEVTAEQFPSPPLESGELQIPSQVGEEENDEADVTKAYTYADNNNNNNDKRNKNKRKCKKEKRMKEEWRVALSQMANVCLHFNKGGDCTQSKGKPVHRRHDKECKEGGEDEETVTVAVVDEAEVIHHVARHANHHCHHQNTAASSRRSPGCASAFITTTTTTTTDVTTTLSHKTESEDRSGWMTNSFSFVSLNLEHKVGTDEDGVMVTPLRHTKGPLFFENNPTLNSNDDDDDDEKNAVCELVVTEGLEVLADSDDDGGDDDDRESQHPHSVLHLRYRYNMHEEEKEVVHHRHHEEQNASGFVSVLEHQGSCRHRRTPPPSVPSLSIISFTAFPSVSTMEAELAGLSIATTTTAVPALRLPGAAAATSYHGHHQDTTRLLLLAGDGGVEDEESVTTTTKISTISECETISETASETESEAAEATAASPGPCCAYRCRGGVGLPDTRFRIVEDSIELYAGADVHAAGDHDFGSDCHPLSRGERARCRGKKCGGTGTAAPAAPRRITRCRSVVVVEEESGGGENAKDTKNSPLLRQIEQVEEPPRPNANPILSENVSSALDSSIEAPTLPAAPAARPPRCVHRRRSPTPQPLRAQQLVMHRYKKEKDTSYPHPPIRKHNAKSQTRQNVPLSYMNTMLSSDAHKKSMAAATRATKATSVAAAAAARNQPPYHRGGEEEGKQLVYILSGGGGNDSTNSAPQSLSPHRRTNKKKSCGGDDGNKNVYAKCMTGVRKGNILSFNASG